MKDRNSGGLVFFVEMQQGPLKPQENIEGKRDSDKMPLGMNIENSTSSFMTERQNELEKKDKIIQDQHKKIQILQEEMEKLKKKIIELENELDSSLKNSDMEINEGNTPGGKSPQSRYWTAEEHQRFLEAIKKYGDKDVKAIAAYVGSRSATQVRTHGQKYNLRLEREKRKKEEEARAVAEVANGSSQSEKTKSNLSKRKNQNMKRRKSLGDSPQNIMKDVSHTRTPPVIPHFIQQQIAAETKDSVLASLNGWTPEQYNSFIEGLVAYSEEKDINIRCSLIAENYLKGFTADEIKQCFTVLSNVAKAKEKDEPHDEFANMEARTKADMFQSHSHYTPNNKPTDMEPQSFRGFRSFGPFQNNSYPHEPPMAGMYPTHFPFFSGERRASFPLDGPNFVKKHPEAADSFYDAHMWQNPNGSEVDLSQLDPTRD